MPTNRKGHSAVVLGSAMLLYGGFVDMKGSSQDFWSLDFGEFKLLLLQCNALIFVKSYPWMFLLVSVVVFMLSAICAVQINRGNKNDPNRDSLF